MLFYSRKYLYHFLQTKINCFVLLMFFATAGYAQNTPTYNDSVLALHFSPVVVSVYKKPVQIMTLHFNPPAYKPYFVQRGGELMHWPSYPLTAGQIEARNREWQRRNNQSIGEQIASDVIKNRVNALIYGRKTAPASVPKF
jgi:hypothetical protein